MAGRRRASGGVSRWALGAAALAIAAAAVVLALLALDHVQSRTPDDAAGPVPTFAPATPSPPATAAPAPMPYDSAAQRFIAAGDGVLWRGTAGACGGTSPSLERSIDEGQTWVDVSPEYLGIGQLLGVDAFAGSQAEIIAGMGPDCEVQLLRTFTQGEFWAPYPDVLAGSTFVDPSASRLVVGSGAPIDTPCDRSHGLRRWGTSVAIVCEGTAYVLDAQTWKPLDLPSVVAIAPDGEELLLASISDACAGIALTRSTVDGSSTDSGCVEASDPTSATALIATPVSITLWSGDDWIKLPR